MGGIFVTGTDTGVGKTVVSAALMIALRHAESVCYWKPIQTGIEQDDDTAAVRMLSNCAEGEIYDRGIRLQKSLSPHLSAKLANVVITKDKILDDLGGAPKDKFWIIEGAGGILVPLNENEMMIDLIKDLSFPVVIVARAGLGTINHTLLTIEALRGRDIEICGVVLNGEPNSENRKAIEHYGQTRVLAEMPIFPKLDGVELKRWSNNSSLLVVNEASN